MTTKRAKSKTAKPLVAWKGFDANLQCLGYQFEVGKTYTHDGKVRACASGFHACEAPFDVWSYYDFETDNRFCRVHLSGDTDRHEGDSKIAAGTIFIESEVTLGEMVRAGVKYEIETAFAKAKTDYATNASSGDYATNASSGHSATNASSGDSARNASSGHSARNASSGHSARNASSGDYATNASSGDSATNASSGHSATNASSGDYATNASSGDYATNASSGHSARNASSGDYATNASSGDYATNASSGHSATNEASGEKSVIAAAGLYSRAKGVTGTAIALPYKDNSGQIRFASGVVGEDGIPADTWLKAQGGKLVVA
jgi:hypothetical protein